MAPRQRGEYPSHVFGFVGITCYVIPWCICFDGMCYGLILINPNDMCYWIGLLLADREKKCMCSQVLFALIRRSFGFCCRLLFFDKEKCIVCLSVLLPFSMWFQYSFVGPFVFYVVSVLVSMRILKCCLLYCRVKILGTCGLMVFLRFLIYSSLFMYIRKVDGTHLKCIVFNL